jgi:hypothetical protein
MASDDAPFSRAEWQEGPDPKAPASSWLSLSDDEVLHKIESLGPDDNEDIQLLAIVHSQRHFFIRQEAAKGIRNRIALMVYQDDRHIGQILVRRLTRREDVLYLENLIARSLHIDVRNAAAAQLAILKKQHGL